MGAFMTEGILVELVNAVQEYDGDRAAEIAERALADGIEPSVILDQLTAGIREVGDAFGAGELFLPELVGAADAMESALPIVESARKEQGGSRSSAGKVVAGTVAGDIHNIGKSIFCTLLVADGFEVIDLGIDVPLEKFIETTEEEKPDVLAMSALLTITAREQQNVIEALDGAGLREGLKVIVGGGAISDRFAESIGADGYSPTAPGGVTLVRDLLG
jgi:corrinoid protein of di/trimethylamine methyltransferase